jgi:quinol monooxygenase YgiN
MERFALLAIFHARPGKENELEAFLKSALPLAEKEPDSKRWYAFKIDASTFGVYDTFAEESGREAHLQGEIAKALHAKADELLAQPPRIEKLDLLAVKGQVSA